MAPDACVVPYSALTAAELGLFLRRGRAQGVGEPLRGANCIWIFIGRQISWPAGHVQGSAVFLGFVLQTTVSSRTFSVGCAAVSELGPTPQWLAPSWTASLTPPPEDWVVALGRYGRRDRSDPAGDLVAESASLIVQAREPPSVADSHSGGSGRALAPGRLAPAQRLSGPLSAARSAALSASGMTAAGYGLHLKAFILEHPGYHGTFTRASIGHTIASRVGGSTSLLPLPLAATADEEEQWARRKSGAPALGGGAHKEDDLLEHAAGIQAWAWLRTISLNYVDSGREAGAVRVSRYLGPSSPTQGEALAQLAREARPLLHESPGQMVAKDWQRMLYKTKAFCNDNLGAIAECATWAQIQPALPPKDLCGRIPVRSLVPHPMAEILADPRQILPPPGKKVS